MSRASPLPAALIDRPFSRSEAVAIGVSDGRLRARDIRHPFYGVHVPHDSPAELSWTTRALATTMPSGNFFGGATAAELYALPLPAYAKNGAAIEVVADARTRVLRRRGVLASTLGDSILAGSWVVWRDFGRGDIFELPVARPRTVWAQLASRLDFGDLVALGDAILSAQPPLEELAALQSIAQASTGRRGAIAMRRALPLLRYPVLSRTETLTRLLLSAAKLPEPAVNHAVMDEGGQLVRTVDLAWPQHRLALQYEGDDHRHRSQFRAGITRDEELADCDWTTMKVHAGDIFGDPNPFLQRVLRRLTRNGYGQRREMPTLLPYRP